MNRVQPGVTDGRPRVAVVGHVEVVEFILLDRLPAPGEIIPSRGAFTRAAGGGGVAAAALAELGAEVDFFCALGRDANGEAAVQELTGRGVRVHVAWREQPTRRGLTLLEQHERTIITLGDRLEPVGSDQLAWERLRSADGVYVTAGDAAALAHARAARVVVASPRARHTLEGEGPQIDALVYSAHDPHERDWARRVGHRARLLVQTEGERGGSWQGASEGRWSAAEPPGEPQDAFGCGDSFAAGFTFGLATGATVAGAAEVGAQRGALALTRTGAP